MVMLKKLAVAMVVAELKLLHIGLLKSHALKKNLITL